MIDAGCSREKITDICRLYDAEQMQEVMRMLRKHRCLLMNELHKSQEKVDCLDYLVRQLDKSKDIYTSKSDINERMVQHNGRNKKAETHRRMG